MRTEFRKLLIGSAVSVCMGFLAGCGNNTPKPKAPNIDDIKPPMPKTQNETGSNTALPQPMDLNKGAADSIIDSSLELTGDSFDINEQIKLRTLLTGYHGFDAYVLDSQVRSNGSVGKLYASKGQYNPAINKFVIDSKDLLPTSKKNMVI